MDEDQKAELTETQQNTSAEKDPKEEALPQAVSPENDVAPQECESELNDSEASQKNEEAAPLMPQNMPSATDESPVAETSEQAQGEGPHFCTVCGASLGKDAAFCAKCGTPVSAPEKSTEETNTTGATTPNDKAAKKPNKKVFAIIGAAAVTILVIVAILVIPPLLRTPDELFEVGEYQAAYEKSSEDNKPEMLERIIEKGKYDIAYSLAPSDEDKKRVLLEACSAGELGQAFALAETGEVSVATSEAKQMISLINGIAYVFKTDCLDDLKDSDSFVLKKAWYGGRSNGLALKVQASNTYGQPVQGYYLFTYSNDAGRYEYYNSVTSLEDETIYKYTDSFSEKLEKYFNNETRDKLEKVMVDSYSIDSDIVESINALFEATKFEGIELDPANTIGEFGKTGGEESA